MTKPISASETGLDPHWKVRVVLPGAILHLASSVEPRMDPFDGLIWEPMDDYRYGDTQGYIDWNAVIGITWRYSP